MHDRSDLELFSKMLLPTEMRIDRLSVEDRILLVEEIRGGIVLRRSRRSFSLMIAVWIACRDESHSFEANGKPHE